VIAGGDARPPLPSDLVELPIPRRPPRARFGTDAARLREAEHDEFLRWRRHLALVEDSYAVEAPTPHCPPLSLPPGPQTCARRVPAAPGPGRVPPLRLCSAGV